jgi:hypothetical protein
VCFLNSPCRETPKKRKKKSRWGKKCEVGSDLIKYTSKSKDSFFFEARPHLPELTKDQRKTNGLMPPALSGFSSATLQAPLALY